MGGGASTLYLLRVIFVERRRWMTQREFLEDWALCRLSPGVHNIALAGLVGRRLAGTRGAAISVAALMLPTGVITAVMTAGFVFLRDQPLIAAALSGMSPVALGMTLGITLGFARTSMRNGRRGALDAAVLVAAVVIGLLAPAWSYPVIIAGALGGTVLLGGERSAKSETPVE